MNNKITRSMLSNKPVIKIGYCAAQTLLGYFDRIGYMSGVYGWNCDVYEFANAYIITGYRMTVKGIRENNRITDIYNGAAQKYMFEHRSDAFESIVSGMRALVNEYITRTLAA